MKMKVNVIMPMLGGGTRMQGCQPTCKPLMRLPDGERFFMKALQSLANYDINQLVLVVLEDYYEEFEGLMKEIHARFNPQSVEIIAHAPTRTPVETFRIGFQRIRTGKRLPLFCLDCAVYGLIPEFLDDNLECGSLFWFPSDNPNKSYLETLPHNASVVGKIAEKRVISNKAVIGAYLFEDMNLLNRLIRYGGTDQPGRWEYISDIFVHMLQDGAVIGASQVAGSVINFGTIEELEQYYGR